MLFRLFNKHCNDKTITHNGFFFYSHTLIYTQNPHATHIRWRGQRERERRRSRATGQMLNIIKNKNTKKMCFFIAVVLRTWVTAGRLTIGNGRIAFME